MPSIPSYEEPAHPFSAPIEALSTISTASYNHRMAGSGPTRSIPHLCKGHDGGIRWTGMQGRFC
jgi:hypothetical protein